MKNKRRRGRGSKDEQKKLPVIAYSLWRLLRDTLGFPSLLSWLLIFYPRMADTKTKRNVCVTFGKLIRSVKEPAQVEVQYLSSFPGYNECFQEPERFLSAWNNSKALLECGFNGLFFYSFTNIKNVRVMGFALLFSNINITFRREAQLKSQ